MFNGKIKNGWETKVWILIPCELQAGWSEKVGKFLDQSEKETSNLCINEYWNKPIKLRE